MRTAIIVRLILVPVVLSIVCVPAASAGLSKAAKAQLFARYDHQNLVVVHEKMLVTLVGQTAFGGSRDDYAINYDYFHPAIAKTGWPKKYQQRNLLDENTTEEVMPSARFTDPLVPGEMVRVMKFYVEDREGFTFVDLYMVALDGKRVARIQAQYGDGSVGPQHEVDYGFHFRLLIPPISAGYAEDAYVKAITDSIDNYVMPQDEYQKGKRAAEAAQEAKKDVTIQPGMTREEVIKVLGDPLKTITFGEKVYLKYAELTVELHGGKVVDIKTN